MYIYKYKQYTYINTVQILRTFACEAAPRRKACDFRQWRLAIQLKELCSCSEPLYTKRKQARSNVAQMLYWFAESTIWSHNSAEARLPVLGISAESRI